MAVAIGIIAGICLGWAVRRRHDVAAEASTFLVLSLTLALVLTAARPVLTAAVTLVAAYVVSVRPRRRRSDPPRHART